MLTHTTYIDYSEWLVFNAKWTIFQLYYGEIRLHVNEMMMSTLY
jgi:hypothetical protein